jgi:uncharacterized protein with PIN domain
MSLNAVSASAVVKCAVILKTADQYEIWKSRVADACWSTTGLNVFEVTDEECKSAVSALEGDAKTKADKPAAEWVGKCWTIITSSLHDELYLR